MKKLILLSVLFSFGASAMPKVHKDVKIDSFVIGAVDYLSPSREITYDVEYYSGVIDGVSIVAGACVPAHTSTGDVLSSVAGVLVTSKEDLRKFDHVSTLAAHLIDAAYPCSK